MAEATADDTKRIIGIGQYEDVDCEQFRVDGAGTVDGHIHAEAASINGRLTVDGDVDTRDLDSDGSLSIAGRLRAEDVTVDGTATVEGDCSADRLDADGSLTVEGNLDCHEIECDGSTTVGGNLVAGEASFDGSVTVDGRAEVTGLDVDGKGSFGAVRAEALTGEGALEATHVDADTFEFDLACEATIETLTAETATVRRGEAGSSFVGRLLGRSDPVLVADTVEGGTLDLAATRAATVAAPTVRLGPGADVETVYADDFEADDDAAVDEVLPYDDY